jgi:uncharacterized protein
MMRASHSPPSTGLWQLLTGSVVITGIDSQKVLDQAIEAIKRFRPMNQAQVAALLDKNKPYAVQGRFELCKTTSVFDATAHHPSWLGGYTPEVEKLSSGA